MQDRKALSRVILGAFFHRRLWIVVEETPVPLPAMSGVSTTVEESRPGLTFPMYDLEGKRLCILSCKTLKT